MNKQKYNLIFFEVYINVCLIYSFNLILKHLINDYEFLQLFLT